MPRPRRSNAAPRRRSPAALTLPPPGAPRNPVVRALTQRAASGAAGRHGPSTGAVRRAERMALRQALRGDPDA